VTHEVVFAPEALADLRWLYDVIADDGGPTRAQNYTDRIIALCLGLVTFPERGTRRDDLRPGLRITTWRRRITIAFHITPTTVAIDRILYGGRDLPAIFRHADVD
jgi:toxin ParE1/3/4